MQLQKKNLVKAQKKKDAVRRCTKGYECKYTAKEKLKHIVSKEAFNIEGLGKRVIEQFFDLNLIKEPADIFRIDYKKIGNMEGWGKLSVSNLKKSISKSKLIKLDKFIFSIGIRHIGQENAKILAAFFVKIDEFSQIFDKEKRNNILQNLIELDGIGQTQIDAIENFFSNNLNKKINKKFNQRIRN